MKLLIIDDLEFTRSYIKKLINAKYNFDIYEADCYNKADELVKNLTFNIIISEYYVNNETICKLIREARTKNDVYFVLLKAGAEPPLKCIPDYILYKPFKPEDVYLSIEEFLKYKPRAQRYNLNIPACIEVFSIYMADVEVVNISKTGALLSCSQPLYYNDFVLRIRNKKIKSNIVRIMKNDNQKFYGIAFKKHLSDNELNEILSNHYESEMRFSFASNKI